MSIATLAPSPESLAPALGETALPRTATSRRPLSLERIALQAAAIVGLLLVNKYPPYGNIVFFGVLAGMFLRSPELAMRALSLGFLGLITNVAFVPKTSVWTVARFGLLGIAFLRFSLDLLQMRRSLFSRSYYRWLVAFIIAAGVGSILGGYFVQIALFKLFSFTIGTTAVFAGVYVLHLRKADLTEWFVSLIAAVCTLGVASIYLGVGYNAKNPLAVTGVGLFNGPFYHPNTAGPFCALLTIYLACAFLLTGYRNRAVLVPLMLTLVYFIAKTQSRTGAATLVLGLMALGAVYIFKRGDRRHTIRKRWSRRGLFGFAAALFLGLFAYDVLTGGEVTRSVVSFAIKRGTSSRDITVQDLLASRQRLIDRSFALFKESPWIGNGFEVDKSEAFRARATIFSAPIEKGFLPTAVLEEVGLLGTIPFIGFAIALASSMYRRLNVPGLVMWIAFIVLNLGEVMIFSPGGHGGMGWILVGAGMLLGDQTVITRSDRR